MNLVIYYFWTFVFGSILGVYLETVWCLIKNGHIESRRGLIYGPFNPLYGLATLLLSFAINSTSIHTYGNIFLIGLVISSTVEYLCSFWQEKTLGTISWDYKAFKFNLNGRINLLYSVIWGILTIIWYEKAMPLIDSLIPYFESHQRLTVLMFMFLLIDSIISLIATIRRKQRHENKYTYTKLEQKIDSVYNDERMNKVYPNSVFTKK